MRNWFFLLAVLAAVSSFAQQPLSSTYVGWKSPKIEMYTIGNNENACTLLMKETVINVYSTDTSGKLIYRCTMRRKPNENFLGGFFKSGQLCLFLDNGNDPGIRSFLYNFSSNELSENYIPFEIKKERIIQRLSSDHYFFYLSIDKKSNEFVLYQFSDEKTFAIHRFQPGALIEEELSNENRFVGLKPDPDVQTVNAAGSFNLSLANCRQKMYIQGDTAFLLMNNIHGKTEVYTFDLQQHNMNYRAITHQALSNLKANESSNSFLLKNKLYYVSANEYRMELMVCDFQTGLQLRSFNVGNGKAIEFINTGLTKKGKPFVPIDENLKSTWPVSKKMRGKRVGISAVADDVNNEVQLMIGFFELKVSSGGGTTFAGNGAFSTTPGPIITYWDAEPLFKLRLQAAASGHLKGGMPPSLYDKIETFTSEMKIPDLGANLIVLKNEYHYYHYDKRAGTLSDLVIK